ncbi:MAG: NDP-sugar synthase [Candidatus Obscuribacterales bacterium]|nr:NDP-sugar synthase [Candidatus Obscuribacterales bacterium]
MKAMVLAAGVGSRLDPLTTQLPKPLVPVANRPVMEHILLLLKKHGFNDVISNLHYQPEKIESFFGSGSQLGMNLEFRCEKELSGDAGGVRACKDFLGTDTFIVLMGDLLTEADLTTIVSEHKRKKALASIAVKQVEDVSQFGVALFNDDGFIHGFQEKPSPAEALSNFASTGIYVLEPEVFSHMPATGSYGFGRQLFPKLIAEKLPVLAIETKDYWSDVGTINQYKKANFDAAAGELHLHLPPLSTKFRCHLEEGAMVEPGVTLAGHLILGKNSRIAPGVTIKGTAVIGDNCVVEKNVSLNDVVIWSNTRIEESAVLENTIIGENCVVSKGCRLVDYATVTSPPSAFAESVK